MAGQGSPSGAPGPLAAAAVLTGALACVVQAGLPPPWLALGATALVLPALHARGWARLPLLAMAAFGWTAWHGGQALQQRLRVQDATATVEGRVDGLPERGARGTRFDLVLTRPATQLALPAGARLGLMAWTPVAAPAAGATVRLQAALRRPRGLANPGGYDFERQALVRRLAAVGKVVAVEASTPAPASSIDAQRERLSRGIAASTHAPVVAGVLRALAVGDQAAIPDQAWSVLRDTGTAHLVAISGFHIGLVAGVGVLLVRLCFRVLPALGLRIARRQAEAGGALASAAAYALLAGASVPVLRTLLMIAVVLATRVARRAVAGPQALALALLVLLAADPLAVLAAGFWLSFAGVAWLIWCLDGRMRAGLLPEFGRAQGVMAIGLLPLTVLWFQQASLVAPLANAVAIPVISLLVLPVLLAGTALLAPAPAAGLWLVERAGDLLAPLWWLLERLAAWPLATCALSVPKPWALACALLGAALVLLPRAVPGRGLGLALWLPLLWPRLDLPPHGGFDLVVLDVGQGLSVLVRTRGHALLYDAGPAPAGGIDAGDHVVAPALTALGVRRLDALVLSHGDNDHAGGARAVVEAQAPIRIRAGPGVPLGTVCSAGEAWTWDGVRFRFLHPPPWFPALGNQSSCVLRVEAGGGAALLPGDIDALVEQRLVDAGDGLPATVVVVPHHGSRSSSSPGFVAAVDPQLALVSAGSRNRFGHPAAEVVQRWQAVGAGVESTPEHGAMFVRVAPGRSTHWQGGWREREARWWRER